MDEHGGMECLRGLRARERFSFARGRGGGAEPLHVSIASEPPHLIPYISSASAPFDVHTISPTKIPSNHLVSFYFIFIRFAPPPLLFF